MDNFDVSQLCLEPTKLNLDSEVMKNDGTTTLTRVTTSEFGLVIKRYNTKNTWHRIRRNFQTSRAKNCYKMSEQFSDLGIDVPEPLVVAEEKYGLVSGRSWFVSKFIPSETLLDVVRNDPTAPGLNVVIDRVMEIFRVLLDSGCSHGDMKATNLLVHDHNITIIDLDAAKKHANVHSHIAALKRDRQRFLKNWNDLPEFRENMVRQLDLLGIP